MEKVRLGLVGLGNMGGGHIKNLIASPIENLTLTAICDVQEDLMETKRQLLAENGVEVATFNQYEDMIASGKIDAVLIATPHYFHPPMAIAAFEKGLHVLSEKPAGVYTKAVREMNEAAVKSGKVFGLMFNQRTNPAYQKLRELVQGGELGKLLRANWIITNWYRTQQYYNSGGWRATWAGEGGGVLLNQDPHQIDLMQWICGVPKRVRAFCYFGKYHDIEVEDDVTAYYEYENGATGLFVTTTGECPGTNRLEITGDRGKAIVEGNKLTHYIMECSIEEHRATSESGFATPKHEVKEYVFENSGPQHMGILRNFADAVTKGTPLLAPGVEGIRGLTVSNAMHMSAWTDSWIDVPFDEEKYYELLQDKIKNSRFVKTVNAKGSEDLTSTYNPK